LYLKPVEEAFGSDVDYAMLVKLYGPSAGNGPEVRYSPGECCGTVKGTVCGNPIHNIFPRATLSARILACAWASRRFTRLTNGFSKKAANHEYALAIYYMHYNFGRIHKTLRVTPAMEAKISDHVWSLEEIAALAN